MTGWFFTLLMALAVSFDALGVGMSYGLRRIRFSTLSLVIICFISGLAAWIGIEAGGLAASVMANRVARGLGAFVFVAMGFWVLLESWLQLLPGWEEGEGLRLLTRFRIRSLGVIVQVLREPEVMDLDRSGVIDPLEAGALGLVMALDAMGIGLAAGMSGTDSYLLPLAVALAKLAFLKGGEALGQGYLASLLRGKLSVLPAVILIILGLARIWE